jgi:subtilase family serine protease
VIGKFEIDADVLLIETPFDVLVTIKNTGTGISGPFQGAVQELNTDNPGQPIADPFDVDGQIAPGESRSITVSVAVQQPGNWQFTAIADFQNDVDESDERDNSKDVTAKVLAGLPDLEWQADGFIASYSGESGADGYKIDLEAKIRNIGTASFEDTIYIGMTWYDEAGHSGDLVPFPIIDGIPPGETGDLSKIDFLPGPGTYKIYATIDSEHVLDELNYDNNQAQVTLTIN